jgi:WD40 repeat protein
MATVAILDPGSADADALAFRPDNRILASGYGHVVTFWNLATRRREGSLDLITGDVNALAFSPDGQNLAVGDSLGKVRIINLTSKKEVLTLSDKHWWNNLLGND